MEMDREDRNREVFHLRSQGLTLSQIANRVGITKGTVWIILHPEYRESKNKRNRERYANDLEYRETIKAEKRNKYARDPEYREKSIAASRKRYKDPKKREEQLKNQRRQPSQRQVPMRLYAIYYKNSSVLKIGSSVSRRPAEIANRRSKIKGIEEKGGLIWEQLGDRETESYVQALFSLNHPRIWKEETRASEWFDVTNCSMSDISAELTYLTWVYETSRRSDRRILWAA